MYYLNSLQTEWGDLGGVLYYSYWFIWWKVVPTGKIEGNVMERIMLKLLQLSSWLDKEIVMVSTYIRSCVENKNEVKN